MPLGMPVGSEIKEWRPKHDELNLGLVLNRISQAQHACRWACKKPRKSVFLRARLLRPRCGRSRPWMRQARGAPRPSRC